MRVIESAAGGQQGCPLIGACHAVVKRMVHESLGLVEPLEGAELHLPRIAGNVDLDIAPLFADDGVIGGVDTEVLRALRHMKLVMPLVGLRFSHLQVCAASFEVQPAERFVEFVGEGCTPVLDGNLEVLKSPIGSSDFCREYAMKFADKQKDLLTFLAELGDGQVTHYLLRWCVNGNRMNYLARTTPPTETMLTAQAFDNGVRDTFAAASAVLLSDHQSRRVSFPFRNGGFGLRAIGDRVDAAYIASRIATRKLCEDIWPGFDEGVLVPDADLQQAISSIRPKLTDATILDGDPANIGQSGLNRQIDAWNVRTWDEEAEPAERVLRLAYSAAGCGAEFRLTPSKTLDMQITQGEFSTYSRLLRPDSRQQRPPLLVVHGRRGRHSSAQRRTGCVPRLLRARRFAATQRSPRRADRDPGQAGSATPRRCAVPASLDALAPLA